MPFTSSSNNLQQHPTRRKSLLASKQTSSTTNTDTDIDNIHMDNDDNVQRSIFHDYDKPIVLLGRSSKGNSNELVRLAESLTQLSSSSSTSTSSAMAPATIQLASLDTKNAQGQHQGLVLADTETLVARIKDKQIKWPNVIVMDWNDPLCSVEESKYAVRLEEYYQEVARTLYEEGLLSIYVNVHDDNSNSNSNSNKEQLEEQVFLPYSDYEVCIRQEGKLPKDTAETADTETATSDTDEWKHIEWELSRILARARLIPAIPGDESRVRNTAKLTMGDNTFFLSLTFPEIEEVEPYVKEMCLDVDAMEYRTDLLKCRDSRFDLLYGMQLLRKYCRPHALRVPALALAGLTVLPDVMPIVYTVRTVNQAGTYPDDEESIAKMFEMLQWGLRGGVEVLDVESAWDVDKTKALLDKAEERYSTQILGSHHVVGKEITTEDAILLYEQCALDGRAHGSKVVLSIDTDDKDRMAYEASLITSELAAAEGRPNIPKISLILGDVGQFSRVINIPFTPVTHEVLPFVAAPGQMTPSEIMTTRLLTGIFSPKKYAILGHNIAYSVSPQMHGAAFAVTKLAHEYVRADVATVAEFVESDFFKSDDFGGTSVTIPHKQSIMPYMDVLSQSAREIGSVNTVIAKEEYDETGFKRVLYGDNTDWRGMFNPLDRLLGGQVDSSTDYALILGAGGTARAAAYVARKLGLKQVYYNRTPGKANELAETFGGQVLTSLDENPDADGTSLGDVLRTKPGSSVRAVISTLPAAANFELPEWLVASNQNEKPIVFDVNYKPYNTKLLLQAESVGCRVVRGSEMLWEQGAGQFELWMGRTAPYRVMKMVVLENCIESESGDTKSPIDAEVLASSTTASERSD